MRRTSIGRMVIFAFLPFAPAGAQERLDLASLLAEAGTHPELRARAERSAAAAEVPPRMGARPDPLLSVSYTNDGLSEITLGDSPFSNVTVKWEQEVSSRGARASASEVARREHEVAQADEEISRARLRRRVIASYVALWRVDRMKDLAEETRATVRTAADAVRVRYEAGDGSQQEVLRAQTEVRRADLEIELLDRERRAAEIALGESLGRPEDPRFAVAGELPALAAYDRDALEDAARSAGREGLRTAAETERAEAALTSAKAEVRTEWGWMAAYQYLGSLDPMVMGGVTVRLPLSRSSNQARAVAENERLAAAARREREAFEVASLARVRDLVSEIETIGRQQAIYEGAIVPEAGATLDAARAAYSAGRAPLSLVLEDHVRLLADRRAAVQLAARRVETAAWLEEITGVRLLALDGTGGAP